MPIPRDVLQAEIDRRLAKTRQMMAEREYDALIVYGNNKLSGSLRYLTDYFPDRAGWISLTPTETAIVDGGASRASWPGRGFRRKRAMGCPSRTWRC